MNKLLATALLTVLATTATAVAETDPTPPSPPAAGEPGEAPTSGTRVVIVNAAPPSAAPDTAAVAAPLPVQVRASDEDGWRAPVGRRFMHGFRLGYTVIMNYDVANRPGEHAGEPMRSLKTEFGLKTPHMMLLGYEGFYRMIGHSWLNVLLVGNVSVAGLEQSKFIPAASGLLGFEFDRSFQLGVGVNLTPDPVSPSHMIVAGGWTPQVGSIQTPVHFFFVPDTESNHRAGVTFGVTW